jgi:phage/plasmid-like protein (TIGR03299 family)
MSAEIEVIAGKAQMVYVGDVPWHGLGTKVEPNLTPKRMLEVAGLDWEVKKFPAYATVDGRKIKVDRSALVRLSDNKVLDVVGDDWHPTQNIDAFNFFEDFIKAGDMEMHTAGSLKGGQYVWALAKTNEGFRIGKKDQVDSYLLFTNPHKFGFAIDVRFTPIRVVCNNTLTLSLNTKSANMVKVSHRRQFLADEVKEIMGLAKSKLAEYKNVAEFLSSRKYDTRTVSKYFNEIWPVLSVKDVPRKDISKSAAIAASVLQSQPGADLAGGTWWNAYNTVTYLTDHIIGRTEDNRLTSAWYGIHKSLKVKALNIAVEYAKAA